jgi:hypothetical protein
MYGTLVGVFPGIADVVRGELDRLLVEGCKELLGEGDFRHDVFLERGVEGRGMVVGGRGSQIGRWWC